MGETPGRSCRLLNLEWYLLVVPADGVGMNDETKTDIPNGSKVLPWSK